MTMARPTAASADAMPMEKITNITPVMSDGKDHEHHAGEFVRIGAVTPEGDEVQVRGVEHQLNADEHEDGVAARQRPGESDAEEQRGENDVVEQGCHGSVSTAETRRRGESVSKSAPLWSCGSNVRFFSGSSRMATTTAPDR